MKFLQKNYRRLHVTKGNRSGNNSFTNLLEETRIVYGIGKVDSVPGSTYPRHKTIIGWLPFQVRYFCLCFRLKEDWDSICKVSWYNGARCHAVQNIIGYKQNVTS